MRRTTRSEAIVALLRAAVEKDGRGLADYERGVVEGKTTGALGLALPMVHSLAEIFGNCPRPAQQALARALEPVLRELIKIAHPKVGGGDDADNG